jgi:hypothetical protein
MTDEERAEYKEKVEARKIEMREKRALEAQQRKEENARLREEVRQWWWW